jgi:hypothetical protein
MLKFGWMDPWPLALELYYDKEGPEDPKAKPGSTGGATGGAKDEASGDASGDASGEPSSQSPDGTGNGSDPASGRPDGASSGRTTGGALSSPAGSPDVTDSRPFGGANLSGMEGAEDLEGALELYVRGLRGTPKAMAGPWESVGRGMALSEGRALYGARFGPPEVLVVRADPKIWELAPYYSGEGGTDPKAGARSARNWAREIPGAALVINGGQYYADRTSMGRLSRSGKAVEPRAHPKWKGFVSSGPGVPGVKPFAVADQELPRAGEDPESYLNVIQSYMVLDRLGQVRVASSDKMASRTAVGEDSEGRICVVLASGAMTLSDLALVLADLEIFPSVSLDGGFESQMALRRGGGWVFYYGEYSHNALGNIWVEEYRPPLYLAAALVPATPPPAPAPETDVEAPAGGEDPVTGSAGDAGAAGVAGSDGSAGQTGPGGPAASGTAPGAAGKAPDKTPATGGSGEGR